MSVHYFLIRSRNYQLSSQHQTFRKARNLEEGIWDSYLSVGREGLRRSSRLKGMIIYQWRETAASRGTKVDGGSSDVVEPLSGFTAFASFRTAQSRFWAYVIAALALGGVGSTLCNLFAALIGPVFVHHGWRKPPQLWVSLSTVPVLLAIAALPAVCLRAKAWWRNEIRGK